jgi:hypothetical protein
VGSRPGATSRYFNVYFYVYSTGSSLSFLITFHAQAVDYVDGQIIDKRGYYTLKKIIMRIKTKTDSTKKVLRN